jgi:hypothetical protein
MKKLLIILTVLLVVGSSCSDFLSVNEKNPNQASSVPVNLILPAALNSSASALCTPGNFAWIYEWYGCWAISGGYSQDANMTAYNVLNSSFQGNWSNAYVVMANYDYIEKNSTAPDMRAFRAIAKIMKSMHFAMLVDIYGNIPYSEALQSGSGILKPAYDNQVDVYEKVVVELDTAMALIDKIPALYQDPGANDIVYNGDMRLWWKFANTLKLRMLMNQVYNIDRLTYVGAAILTTPHTTDDYIGVGEGAMNNPGYLQSTGKMNPFYERFYKQDGSQQADGLGYFVPGQDACDFMVTNTDPRKLLLFAPYSGSLIQGNYFGNTPLNLPSVTSKLGTGMLKTYGADAAILTDFESLFLQAEAADLGLITGDAKVLYESAVTRSIIYEGSNAAAAGVYLTQASNQSTNWEATPNKLKLIIEQKWLALNGVSAMPIWNDWRRTGYPDFIHWSTDPLKLNPTPPIRLLYPQTEIATNNDNVLKQGTINTFTTNIFWMPTSK